LEFSAKTEKEAIEDAEEFIKIMHQAQCIIDESEFL
jgi:hypothetical protein